MARLYGLLSQASGSLAVALLAIVLAVATQSASANPVPEPCPCLEGETPEQCDARCLASKCKDSCKAGTPTGDSQPGKQTGPCLDSSGSCDKEDPNGNYSCKGCNPGPVYDENDEIVGCEVTCTGRSISPG